VFVVPPGGNYKAIYSFGVGVNYGANPYAGLVLNNNGIFFGATYNGGTNGLGTVFEFVPSGTSLVTPTVLHSFTGGAGDGAGPYARVSFFDLSGNIYGTTLNGGAFYDGAIFRLPSVGGASTLLHSFNPSKGEGTYPRGGLIQDNAANIYGTTSLGGASNKGAVYKLSWNGSYYIYSSLHDFAGGAADGANPWAGLVIDSAGNLYGTTLSGGQFGNGAVFKLTPNGSGGYSYTVLYSFAGGATDGASPYAGLALDSAGNLYGTTYKGGQYGKGIVFQIVP
jgi:uncharacterized repeat protein (TIGR03803 family)